MASTAVVPQIPVGEYLGSVYRPDVDYVDGVLEERNVGEIDHADIQSYLITLFRTMSRQWNVRSFAEARVQVAPTRFRVPDVCVLPAGWARSRIVQEAPLLCMEVVSPRDTIAQLRLRCQDYLLMGVPEVWIFDPESRMAYVLRGSTMTEHREGSLRLEGTPIEVRLADVFGVLDQN
jgi:Uma2 family endonuclease